MYSASSGMLIRFLLSSYRVTIYQALSDCEKASGDVNVSRRFRVMYIRYKSIKNQEQSNPSHLVLPPHLKHRQPNRPYG